MDYRKVQSKYVDELSDSSSPLLDGTWFEYFQIFSCMVYPSFAFSPIPVHDFSPWTKKDTMCGTADCVSVAMHKILLS